MKVVETPLPGLLLLEPDVHRDERGWFVETWRQDRFAALGLPEFAQDNWSRSARNVLRGLHFEIDDPQDQLVYVTAGRVFDVAVDLRPGSPTFGRWHGEELSADNARQMFLPGGFAHGFCVLDDFANVHYKCTRTYRAGNEGGVLWNDPEIGIRWPVEQPRIKPRDAAFPRLAALGPSALPGLRRQGAS